MYSLRLEWAFPVSNTVSLICCTITMFLSIVVFELHFLGFILGYTSRFVVEIVFNCFYLCKHYPPQARQLPNLKELKEDLKESIGFTVVFVLGYTIEQILFEVIPMIFFRSKDPLSNIALWMSIYPIIISCKSLLESE